MAVLFNSFYFYFDIALLSFGKSFTNKFLVVHLRVDFDLPMVISKVIILFNEVIYVFSK